MFAKTLIALFTVAYAIDCPSKYKLKQVENS